MPIRRGKQLTVDHATDAHHGQAAVLDLGKRVALGSGLVLGEVERVELEVARGTLALEGLEERDGAENLKEREPEKQLAHSSLLHEDVMDTGHLGAADDPVHTREGEDVLGHGTGSGKHGNAAVLELRLAEELDVRDLRAAERVEADVADHGAVQGSGLLEERNRRRHRLHLRADGGCHEGGGGQRDAQGCARLQRGSACSSRDPATCATER